MYLNFVHGAVDVVFIVEHIFNRNLTDLDIIRQEELVDGLCSIRHEDAASESGFLEEIGQGSSMIQVEVSDEKHVHGGRVDLVEVRKSGHSEISRVDSAIEQDGFAFVGHVDA